MRALRVLRRAEDAITTRVARHVARELATSAGPSAAARRAHAEMDQVVTGGVLRGLVPACSAGCSFCCHVHVEVTAAEVHAITDILEGSPILESVVLRLAMTVPRVTALSAEERWAARIPCALLGDDGRCSIYAARPLACRALHSRAVEACREAFDAPECTGPDGGPPTYRALDRSCDAVERGFDTALRDASLDTTPQLLEPALLALLKR